MRNRLDHVACGRAVSERQLELRDPEPDVVGCGRDPVGERTVERGLAQLAALVDLAPRGQATDKDRGEAGLEVLLLELPRELDPLPRALFGPSKAPALTSSRADPSSAIGRVLNDPAARASATARVKSSPALRRSPRYALAMPAHT